MPKYSLLTLVSSVPQYAVHILTWRSAMDTDKIKIFGARVKVDGTGKLAELERAERVSACLEQSG
jgi:hypothetical protein